MLSQIDFKNLQIVEPSNIPKGLNCPKDDLFSLFKLALSMETLCKENDGAGLSAVQLGIPINFFIVKYSNEFRHFIDCSYVPLGKEKFKSVEGCLSLKDKDGNLVYFEVERYKQVVVKGKELVSTTKLAMKNVEMELTEFKSIVFQHEIDHGAGILISDIGKEVVFVK